MVFFKAQQHSEESTDIEPVLTRKSEPVMPTQGLLAKRK